MGKENWKDVVGYEGKYKVSDQGRVKSLERYKKNHSKLQKVHERIMKPIVNGHRLGYVQVGLGNGPGKSQRIVLIHRLVLEAFVGPCPEGMECCHNDGDGSNNNLDNLRWDTPRNNQLDRTHQGTWICGEKVSNARFTNTQVKRIKEEIRNGTSLYKLARQYKVHITTLSLIKKGKTWKHIE